MKTLLATASTAALCFALAACSSTSAVRPDATESVPATPTAMPAQGAPVASETDAQRLARLQAELTKNSVYFDLDDHTLKPQYRDTVHQNAEFMNRNGNGTVTLEGNADERGSREYNLALGQKRAEAVKKTLLLLGAKEEQAEAVSLGEEKPRCNEQTEACWGENRRADILYTGEF